MQEKWYWELENKFPDVKCMNVVIMPNHFHCIIHKVEADQRVCLKNQTDDDSDVGNERIGSPLPDVVRWFKTMTTNEYIRGVKTLDWQRFDGKLWQRNYWEYIIRNKKSLERIANYIDENPLKWEKDKLFNQKNKTQ